MVLLLLLLAISGLLASFLVLAVETWPRNAARRSRRRRARARSWPVSPLAEFAPLPGEQVQEGQGGEQRRQQRQGVQPPLRVHPRAHRATVPRTVAGAGPRPAGRDAPVTPARPRPAAAVA
jgi:hypothetical protein